MPTIKLLDGPEGLTLAETKAHLRVDHDSEDALIQTYISASRGAAEAATGRAITVAQYRLVLPGFPEGPIDLTFPPLVSIQSLKYFNPLGQQITMAAQDYLLDSVTEPARLSPLPGLDWPEVQERINAIEVNFTAGYSQVPADIKAWMLLAVTELYERRSLSSDKAVIALDLADGLLDRYKVWDL
jgi:uncharacterized phiE125 gp8 family phage protein